MELDPDAAALVDTDTPLRNEDNELSVVQLKRTVTSSTVSFELAGITLQIIHLTI